MAARGVPCPLPADLMLSLLQIGSSAGSGSASTSGLLPPESVALGSVGGPAQLVPGCPAVAAAPGQNSLAPAPPLVEPPPQ